MGLLDFRWAIEMYDKAINLKPEYAVCYSSRSLAYLGLESYEQALTDANASIRCDEKYLKGYFNRAAANMALTNYRDARSDWEFLKNAENSECIQMVCQRRIEECNEKMSEPGKNNE